MPLSSSKSLFLIAFLSAAVGLVGCQQEGTAEEAGKKMDQTAEKAGDRMDAAKESLSEKAESTGNYMDDAGITAKIKADILRDSSLKVFQIHVTTTKGVVTLSGTLDSQLMIDRAVDLARGTQNVTSVENNLILKLAD
ncbi:transporter [Thiocystis violacea]|nr:transporter [Thiocystis violacea]